MRSRNEIVDTIKKYILDDVCKLYQLEREELELIPEYRGFENIIYMTQSNRKEYVRVTFRKDRTYEEVMAEVSFINHLYENGASVSNPIKSKNLKYVEQYKVGSDDYYVVVFNKAKGIRLPDNGYRYRDGVSIDEYFFNYGKVLGKMHYLAKSYVPTDFKMRRPDWLHIMQNTQLPLVIPSECELLHQNINQILNEASQLPRDRDAFGLIHADFDDGNFTIDYTTGNITVFDFDGSAYCWFMFDLARAWVIGVGWCQFEPSPEKREAMMKEYFDKVLLGYYTENTIGDKWLEKLPFFIKLVDVEGVLSRVEFMLRTEGEIEFDEELQYRVKCLTDDIPYRGFFSKIYSEKAPFCIIK